MKKLVGDNTVLSASMIITSIFVIFGIFFNDQLGAIASLFLSTTTNSFGWFYLMTTLVIVIFAVILLLSRFGQIRLGQQTDRPTFSTLSWLAMLFSAGMGVGLLFWGVAEPIYHYTNPPYGQANTTDAANLAMNYTFFHWGLHPWAIYTAVGLSLAFFQFRKKLPALISSTFYPILGDKIYGPIGKSIDILATFATLFGVATSLGLGTMQIAGGLHYLFNFPNTITTQVTIIGIITVLFMISALTGLSRGIKILSNVNIIIAISVMAILIVVGPTSQIFKVLTNTMGGYLDNFLFMSLNIRPFGNNSWIASWTLFYWAWWIAWSPFVGSFIARVSKGRTIKEFILGVLFIPALGTFVWFSTFGGSALNLVHNLGKGSLAEQASSDITVTLFAFFQHFPLGDILSILSVILIVTFFVTSADSATFILGMYSSNGELDPSKKIKVIWGMILSAVSTVLLLSGSLETLQTASIAAAFPFSIIVVLMCYSLLKGLQTETLDPSKRKMTNAKISQREERNVM